MRSTNTWQTFGERTITITHNPDGSYSSSKSGSFTTTASSGYSLKSGSASVTVKPATIPRASQPSLVTYPNTTQNVTIGSTITIHMNKKASFTHTVRYAWGNKSGTIATGVTDNCQWSIPMDFCDNIPNSTSGTGTVYVDTYSGSTKVGTKSVGFTGIVPDSVVPSISSITLGAGNATVPSTWGAFVQGKSSLKVVTTAVGSYSSTIKEYKVTGIDNDTYWSSNFTSSILQLTGTRTIAVKVTDSRGRTATKTTTYTCIAYSNPKINSASVTRCNSDGTANEEGEYVKYTFKASVSSVNNKNTYVYKIGHKKSTDSSYTYIAIENNAYSLDKSGVVISGVTFSVDNSYDFQFFVSDYFTSTTNVQHIATGFTLMDFRSTGKGMAIGKVSEKDAFEVGMASYFNEETTMNKSSGDTFYHAYRTDTGTGVSMGVGAGGVNHGIYSRKLNKWMIYADNSNVYVNNYKINSASTKGVKTLSSKSDGGWSNQTDGDAYLITKAFMAYWNGAYSGTSSNLTYCYQGTIQAKPVSLYNNSSGTNGTLTLSETSANFTCLEIYYRTNDGTDKENSVKIYSPNGKTTSLVYAHVSSGGTKHYWKVKNISISGTNITSGNNTEMSVNSGTVNSSNSNNIYIIKVMGYR